MSTRDRLHFSIYGPSRAPTDTNQFLTVSGNRLAYLKVTIERISRIRPKKTLLLTLSEIDERSSVKSRLPLYDMC